MSRNPNAENHDQVLPPAGDRGNLYRIHAVEAHSWSTVLIEDKFGRLFLAVSRTGKLSELDRATVDALLRARQYRVWNGDRAWAPLDRLPLLSGHHAGWETLAPSGSDAAL